MREKRPASARHRRVRKRIRLTALAALLLGVTAFLTWCSILYPADTTAYAIVADEPAIVVTSTPDALVLSPAGGATDVGLVFVPGAKVPAQAYAYKLSGLVETGVTVVVTKPILNLAFFDLRPLSTFTDIVPEVDRWYVGGHSLGGVKACSWAGDSEGLVLFGSYCAGETDASTLSVGASDDGLSTPADIRANAAKLPDDAQFVEIEGANHASFGDYGPQPGDGGATLTSAEMRDRLTAVLTDFVR